MVLANPVSATTAPRHGFVRAHRRGREHLRSGPRAIAGASDLEVAKWAGHRSAAFTKSRYAHLFPEHGEALADRLEAFIAASTSTPAATVTNIRPACLRRHHTPPPVG